MFRNSATFCTEVQGVTERFSNGGSTTLPTAPVAPGHRAAVVDRLRGSLLKILSFSPNLERLVLRCIDSYDSESRRIFQHFSRTTRSTILCTAQISKFQEKVARFFRKNETFIFIFIFIPAKFYEFCHFSAEFWWKFVGSSRGIAGNCRYSRY